MTFASGPTNYWLSCVADVSGALLYLTWEIGAGNTSVPAVVLAGTAGYVLWGLFEYVFHRWLYHRKRSFVGDAHRLHHEAPLVLLATPWFMTSAVVYVLWFLGSRILRVPYFSACLAGWLAGSIWYSLLHHSHHHWGIRNRWIRRLRTHHRIHHQLPRVNFGVTLRFWDDVFGTRYRGRIR